MNKRTVEHINSAPSPVSLEFGCGPRPAFPEYISVDLIDYPNVDIVGDAFEVLAQIQENRVEAVFASHFLEHIDDVDRLLKEVVRVSVPGAKIRFQVPHFSNAFFYSDITHRVFFGLYSFCYLAESAVPFRRTTPDYAQVPGLVLRDVRLTFKSYRPRYIRHGIRKLVEKLVNLNVYTKEFYEENLTGIISCYELDFVLEVQKPADAAIMSGAVSGPTL